MCVPKTNPNFSLNETITKEQEEQLRYLSQLPEWAKRLENKKK